MIESFDVYTALVPMSRPFVHSTKSRSTAESVLLRISGGGRTGWGESAPRPYVTGESVDSVVETLQACDVSAIDESIDWTSFETSIKSLMAMTLPGRPAAHSAIELALLDLICRIWQQPANAALQLVDGAGLVLRDHQASLPVSLVIDLADDPAGRLAISPDWPPPHVKLKAAVDVDLSIERIKTVMTHLGRSTSRRSTTVSVDANCGWAADQVIARAPELANLGLSWIEEPTRARDWDTLAQLTNSGINIMLDESFVDAGDLYAAVREQAASHVNLRVSKCGGLLSTVKLAAAARELGLEFQLGVQVGELGPLWACGRIAAANLLYLRAVEVGRQDEWFPEPLTEPPYFVDRAHHIANAPTGPGLGVVPSKTLIDLLQPVETTSSTMRESDAK